VEEAEGSYGCRVLIIMDGRSIDSSGMKRDTSLLVLVVFVHREFELHSHYDLGEFRPEIATFVPEYVSSVYLADIARYL